MGPGLLDHTVRKKAAVEDDVCMFKGAIVTPFPCQQPFNDDVPTGLLIGPSPSFSDYKAFVVVLVQCSIDNLLWVQGLGDDINTKTIHKIIQKI